MKIWQSIAEAAMPYVVDCHVVGLGTGRTVEAFIDVMLAQQVKPACLVVSSERTRAFCEARGLQVEMPDYTDSMDVYLDGVDYIDPDFIGLKGGGGAMTGERLCAEIAQQFVMLADASKCVNRLHGVLVVEVVPWAVSSVARKLLALGGDASRRHGFTTDMGNPVLDVSGLNYAEAYTLSQTVAGFCGVVSHGLFADCQPDVLVSSDEKDQISIKENPRPIRRGRVHKLD